MRAWRWVVDRFDRRAHLGLHLTLTLVVGVLAIWALSALLDAVLDNATLVRLDMFVDARIHSLETPAGLALFTVISRIGSPVSMGVLGAIGAVALWVRREPRMCVAWIAAFVGSAVLERTLKVLVHRSRPSYAGAALARQSFSFPSGHAMGSFIGFGMLVYVVAAFWRAPRRVRLPLIVAASIIVLLVGVSRVYLGVHYPSDVLGGYAAAAAWMAACVGGLAVALHRRDVSSK
ncbi:MAG: phosphatase PAP2 family protein [Gemmatimonadales bacterium]